MQYGASTYIWQNHAHKTIKYIVDNNHPKIQFTVRNSFFNIKSTILKERNKN